MPTYLMGFNCYNYRYGCECNIDVDDAVKEEFERIHGFPYDEYCLYSLCEADNEMKALELAYIQCGAAEEEMIWENFPDVEVICEV